MLETSRAGRSKPTRFVHKYPPCAQVAKRGFCFHVVIFRCIACISLQSMYFSSGFASCLGVGRELLRYVYDLTNFVAVSSTDPCSRSTYLHWLDTAGATLTSTWHLVWTSSCWTCKIFSACRTYGFQVLSTQHIIIRKPF